MMDLWKSVKNPPQIFGYHHLNSHLQYVLWYQYHLQVFSIYWAYHFTFNLRFHVYFVGVEGQGALNDKYVPKEFCHLSNEYLIVKCISIC